MNLVKTLLTASVGVLAVAAQAQVTLSLGPTVSVNASTVHHPDDSYRGPDYDQSTRITGRTGWEAGVLGTLGWRHVALQASGLFAQKGFESVSQDSYRWQRPRQTDTYGSVLRLHYLTLPLNVVVRQRATGQGLQAFAGAYLGWLVGGHNDRFHSTSTSPAPYKSRQQVRAGDQALTDRYTYSRRQDRGLQAGVGYRYRGLHLQVGYSWGLRNLAVDYRPIWGYQSRGFSGPPYYHRVWQTSLAYVFDLSRP